MKGMHLFFNEFLLDHRLQSSLEREAHTLRMANEAKMAQKSASQKADSIINHILKNMMADAVGCVELFQADGVPDHLQRAQECLMRGMNWCKKRQAMIRLTLGQYTPILLPTHLPKFGAAVACHRNVTLHCPRVCVRLDPILCDVVCDNAISNAFRHGHPDDPAISLAMRLAPAELGSARHQLSFVIRNRANPARPQIPPNFLEMLLIDGGVRPYEGMSSLSDGIGLEHIYTAAKAQAMSVSLEQVGDVVIFTATMEVDVDNDVPQEGATVAQVDAPVFHHGLRFACIDDSEVARLLMTHNLQLHAKAASVEVFGQQYGDVDRFLHHVLGSEVDVVVLDQNLQYPQATILGTDLVRRLLAAGFSGLVCLRTANAEECDREFYRSCGVHCVIGKDITGTVMVAQLMTAYSQHIDLGPPILTTSCCSLSHDIMWGDSEGRSSAPLLPIGSPEAERSPPPGVVPEHGSP
eukprot:GGOE01033097.1.p1 GENE.GGOE01033097.1~~GGOE01033097.1.p1  ORF type:complete len:466 (-),score=109.15 GGOE01033097.1:835-2232(-)